MTWQALRGGCTHALCSPANHIFLHGTRGSGKTEIQIAKYAMHVGQGYGPFWKGIIFDREYKNLDDVIGRSKRIIPQIAPRGEFLSSNSALKWVWPGGEELLFRAIKKLDDYDNFHGHEYPFQGWNELPKYPTSELYDKMMSCNRTSFVPADHSVIDEDGNLCILPEIPLIVFSTGNAHGAGYSWCKERFIDAAPMGKVIKTEVEIMNPRTDQREFITTTQVTLFAHWKDNRHLSPKYIADLHQTRDPALRKAWYLGSWDVPLGGFFCGSWSDACIVEKVAIPEGWRVFRALDWGTARPFSVGWWALANGEETESGWCPPRGSMIRINEWYGSKKIGTNKGLGLGPTDVAKGIVIREKAMIAEGLVSRVSAGPADSSIFSAEPEQVSIASKMAVEGVEWEPSDKRPGSRVNGHSVMREMMVNAKAGAGPGLFSFRDCKAFISLAQSVPKDDSNPDDVDTDAEDHVIDESRYAVLSSGHTTKVKLHVRMPT
jgi:hypothetical protein